MLSYGYPLVDMGSTMREVLNRVTSVFLYAILLSQLDLV
jgi:hypothetical protein